MATGLPGLRLFAIMRGATLFLDQFPGKFGFRGGPAFEHLPQAVRELALLHSFAQSLVGCGKQNVRIGTGKVKRG